MPSGPPRSVAYISPSSRWSAVAANHRHSLHTVPSAFVAVAATCSKPSGTTASGASVVAAEVVPGGEPAGGVIVVAGGSDVVAVAVDATSSPPHEASTRAAATTSHRIPTTVASGSAAAGSGDATGRHPQQARQRPVVAGRTRDQQRRAEQ